VILVGVYLTIAAWKGERRFSKPLEEFLSSLSDLPRPVILVAFGDPYIIGRLPETTAILTPLNGTILAEASIARAMAGKIEIRGRLPVTIPGRFPRGTGIMMKPQN
jgi:beta-N-acetylhexosaminidase